MPPAWAMALAFLLLRILVCALSQVRTHLKVTLRTCISCKIVGLVVQLAESYTVDSWLYCSKDDSHLFVAGVVRMTNMRDGCTAVHRAVESGQYMAIPILIEADPLVKDKQNHAGQTALHVACKLMNKKCITALLVQSDYNYRRQIHLFLAD